MRRELIFETGKVVEVHVITSFATGQQLLSVIVARMLWGGGGGGGERVDALRLATVGKGYHKLNPSLFPLCRVAEIPFYVFV